jgi:hypothetical protein
MGSGFLDIKTGYSKFNENHSLTLIVSMAFLDRGPRILEHMPFPTHYPAMPKLSS